MCIPFRENISCLSFTIGRCRLGGSTYFIMLMPFGQKIIMLKKILFLSLFSTVSVFAQKKLPVASLVNLKGETISSAMLTNDNRPVLISFWATWCKPCLQEIQAINQNLEAWQKETNVRFVAISVDDSRSKARVATLANAKKWNFEVLIDENGDFQRAMNVLNVPHSFVLDAKGNVIYQHNAYALGDEEEYIKEIRKAIIKKQ